VSEGFVSQPPEYPGSRRLKRAAASAGSSAYQGVFEAVGSILIACGLGYWIDRSFETAPVGVLVGAVIGFAAFVVRLVRLGKELHPDSDVGRAASANTLGRGSQAAPRTGNAEDNAEDEQSLGTGVDPGMSDVLRDDAGRSDAGRSEKQ
jgi:F0F1-type ATP synthase assembly protein I